MATWILAIAISCGGADAPPEKKTVSEGPADPAPGAWERLRPALLGHAIEWDRARDVYRLVEDSTPPREIATGTLEACEEALLAALEARYGKGRLNLPLVTLGAKQFWGDRFAYAGWRIQENVLTGHCRLLDRKDVRRAWGTYEACRVAFEKARRENSIRPASDHWVFLVHGLGRSRASWSKLSRALRTAGYEPVAISYPTTRRSIEEHAEALAALLDCAEDVRTVSFVTHSLGGIVVRETLARDGAWKKRIAVDRLVMLAPPSKGSRVAEILKDFLPFEWITGETGQGLTPERAAKVPLPACPFGIIAGGRGDGKGYNPIFHGDNDGVVSVEEAKLDGAADFLLVNSLHSFIMNHPDAIRAALHRPSGGPRLADLARQARG